MTLTKPTAILFDWDNTLVDTWPTIHTALNMTLRHMQHPEWSLEKVKTNVKQSMRDAFPAMFGDRWEEAAEHYQRSYRSIHLDHLQPLAGAAEMLSAAQVPLGVVSNKRGDTLRTEMHHLGWENFFTAAVGAGDAARDKPHAEPALLALEHLKLSPTRSVWLVGDTVVDLQCAEAAGLTPILYGDHITQGTAHEGAPFAAHARDLQELREMIG